MHIHFIGVGGISMSALAKICLNKGHKVSGCDSTNSYILNELKSKGATIYLEQNENHITDDIDLAVYTAAVKENHPEIVAIKNKGIKIMDRAHFLGSLMGDYKNAIAIAGTHGKTSTTSMTSLIFERAGLDPTILIGGNLKEIGGNLKIGSSQNFITEACEYVNSFLSFKPTIGVILNIEADHLDYFSSLNDIKESFNKFGKLLPNNGYLIVNGDDKNVLDVLNGINAKIIKYGMNSNNDIQIRDVSFNNLGHPSFHIMYEKNNLGIFSIDVPGIHNIYNATAAIICSLVSNIDIDSIKENINRYKGVGRRFEFKGKINDCTIIDDYAHHPTEIKATLSAAKNMCQGKIWCIFQPHTYTRTKSLLNDFSNAFFDADKVIITDIYAAREADTGEIHSKDLVAKLVEHKIDAIYMKDFNDISIFIKENCKKEDLIITAGAGDVYLVSEKLIQN